MDTVNMLNKMSFYCQPILPLVYDESMSYYETLCKVVGQLNTTGETVNKLNEGLTGEIADRQASDAALDERLKLIEGTNAKIHFLIFDGANPNGGFPTRSELYQWVHEGDAIFTLFRTYEEGRGQIYAASCSYNAGNWGSEASNDFSIIVPLETSYDAAQDYAVRQKVAKLSIPLSPQTNLNVAWRLQIIEVNTPYTSADGVVNLVAVINDSDSVNCSITPSEFLGLYNMTRGGKNLCVAVNAKLAYDGLARSSSVATVDKTNRKIRIAFERDYGTFINNGVKQLNKTLDYIIGDASTNVWTHETIDSKTLDFTRYEGFQFTRGENNVITANDESTPNAVYAQYNSDTSGKIYQNLPVRLIDTVDNAEYWNGVFGIKDNKHMTFTFVTSNYVTASGKMLVRVIELSADVNTTTWKYAVKEFTLPITGGSSDTVYVDFWPTGSAEEYDKDIKGYTLDLATDQTFDAIFDSIKAGNKVVARLYEDSSKSDYPVSSVDATVSGDKTLGTIHFQFVSAGTGAVAGFAFIGETITLIKTSSGTSIFLAANENVLPTPNSDGSDNGKVPTINGTSWVLKTPDAGNSVPKPLTYDYMPEGYPKKTTAAVTVMGEQELAFAVEEGTYVAHPNKAPEIVEGQTYIVTWDGADYECVCSVYFSTILALGNKSIYSAGDDTGEPFLYLSTGTFATLSTSASHTISIKTTAETATPMAEEFLPVASENNYGAVKKSEIVTPYKFDTFAPHDLMVKAINEFRDGRASIVWGGALVVAAEHDSSTDKITVRFARNPYKIYTKENLNGYYIRTTGDTSYDELETTGVRLPVMNTNDKNANCLLTADGTPSDMTLKIMAKHLRLDSFEILNQKELYLKSSTTDSTKRFKITVDDNGTISATEVTA